MLIFLAGLPGTGKSTLCRAIAEYCKGAVLDKDIVRAALFEPGRVRYTSDQDDLVQEVLLRTAEWLLREDPGLKIFLDGRTFSRQYQLMSAIAAADKMDTQWKVIECVCKTSTAIRRIENDQQAGTHPAKNRTVALYNKLLTEFEPITVPKIVVDTDRPITECIVQAIYSL